MKYAITPTAKPRMTKRDSWAKRPCVLRYRAFKDSVRERGVVVHDSMAVVFHIAMPDSWSRKKRARMRGLAHRQCPDIDNLVKGLLDAALEQDSTVWQVWAIKRWSDEPYIEIRVLEDGAYGETGPAVTR